eukprot:5981991-Pyramimonas_sp.AAC.1
MSNLRGMICQILQITSLSVNAPSQAAMKAEDMEEMKKAMAAASDETKAAIAQEMAATREALEASSEKNDKSHAATLAA